MEIPESVEVKILSTPSFVNELEAEAKNIPKSIKIVSIGEERDPTKLAFEIGDVESAVTIITGVFYLGEMSVKIFQWLKKSEAPKVVLETPIQNVEIENREDLTESEVRKTLQNSLEEQ